MRTLRASIVCGALATSMAGFLFTVGAFGPFQESFPGLAGAAGSGGPSWAQWLGAAILGFGLAWTTIDISHTPLKIVVAAVALAETAALSWLLLPRGIVWPPFTALAAGLLAALFGLLYGRSTEGRRKREIEWMFGGRISKATFRKLLESDEPLSFAGERREASVVVCEIFNLELLADALGPVDYVALTNGFLAAGAETLMEGGGILEDCGGERLRAIFGAPLADPGHAARACETGLALSRRLEAFCKEAVERWKAAPDYRIGINSGEMIAASYGAGQLGSFSATGESLEFCRKLCVANTFYGSRILLGPRVFQLASGAVEVRPIELIRPRGQRAPEEIYELLAPKNQLSPEEADRRDRFWKGVVLFRERRWDDAAYQFKSLLGEGDAGCEDAPTRFYLDRIAHARDGMQALDSGFGAAVDIHRHETR